MNLVLGDNVRDGGVFTTGVTAAGATTDAVAEVPGAGSSAHPSPIAVPARTNAHNHVCCLISFLPLFVSRRLKRKQARPPVLAPRALSKPRVHERTSLHRTDSNRRAAR